MAVDDRRSIMSEIVSNWSVRRRNRTDRLLILASRILHRMHSVESLGSTNKVNLRSWRCHLWLMRAVATSFLRVRSSKVVETSIKGFQRSYKRIESIIGIHWHVFFFENDLSNFWNEKKQIGRNESFIHSFGFCFRCCFRRQTFAALASFIDRHALQGLLDVLTTPFPCWFATGWTIDSHTHVWTSRDEKKVQSIWKRR